MINKYLQQLQESTSPKVLYHASDRKVNILTPRLTNLATAARPGVHHESVVWAGEEKYYAYGLERVNLFVPYKFTEKEVLGWKKLSWLEPTKGKLFIWYWNHVPTKPGYLYTVSSEGFEPFEVGIKTKVTHWYKRGEVVPLKVEKYYPNQVKKVSWKIATDEDRKIKLARFREKKAFK